MKRQKSFLRYFVVAVLAIVSMALVLTACNKDKETTHAVTWEVAEHATVVVDGYDTLPEKAKDKEVLTFTVTPEEGYAVDEVLWEGHTANPNSAGKYSVTISADTKIQITVKMKVTGISVRTKPNKLSYEAGEALDKAGMVVVLEYAAGDPQPTTEYRIRYQGGLAASRFGLGDTYFTVYYEDVETKVDLDGPAAAVITLDPMGGTISEEYVTALKANTELTGVETSDGVLTFRYTAALTADVALPAATDLSKGEEGDYAFNSWKVNGEGDGFAKLSKETAVSISYQADWTAHLFNFTSIELTQEDGDPYLIVKGTYQAATSLYMFFTEGNRNIIYKANKAEETVTGNRGEEFTLKVNLMQLTEAEAQDGGSFVGPWLDLRFGYDVDGRTESMEIPYNDALETVSVTDSEEIYRFGFAKYGEKGHEMLKVVITMLTPYTYEMHVDNTDDVLTLTIDGQIREKLISKFAGMTAKMDWYINGNGTVNAPDATIAADGKFQFKFVLSPENGFALDALGYAHFSIVDEEGGLLYKDGTDGNLLSNALTNRDDFTKHEEIPNSDFGGVSLMISNEDGTLVYYVGIPNWDAIVIYGMNPKAPRFTSSGDVELKVDDYENPTKVYFVIKLTVENLTDDGVNAILLGNTDGDINVYESDSTRMSKLGNVYTLWFDVTAYTGTQLWPNLYTVSDGEDGNPVYTKVGEFGGDSDYSTNGLYAIVNNVKYSIICSESTWSRPCLVVGAPGDGETNPPETDPNAVKKEIVIDAATFTLVDDSGKPYVKFTVNANGFAKADELKNAVQYGNFDAHDEGEEDDFEWKTPCVKVDDLGNDKFTLWFDISAIEVDTDGRLWSNLFFNGTKMEIKDTTHASHNVSITIGDTIYTVECTGANGTWDIPCITLKEVGAPEYTATGADLVLEGEKVYFVVSGTSANYEDNALKTVLESVYFDLQERGDDWTRCADLARTVSVEKGVWSIKFDVTSMALHGNPYTSHFGGESTDLKLSAEQAQNLKSVSSGNKTYVLVNRPGSVVEGDNWGNVSLRVYDSSIKFVSLDNTKTTLEVKDGHVYLVLKGELNGYTKDDLTADIQSCGEGNLGGDWTYPQVDVTAEVEGNQFTVKIDVTNVSGTAPFVIHLKVTGQDSAIDVFAVGDNLANEQVILSETNGNKTYSLTVYKLWNSDRLLLKITEGAAE